MVKSLTKQHGSNTTSSPGWVISFHKASRLPATKPWSSRWNQFPLCCKERTESSWGTEICQKTSSRNSQLQTYSCHHTLGRQWCSTSRSEIAIGRSGNSNFTPEVTREMASKPIQRSSVLQWISIPCSLPMPPRTSVPRWYLQEEPTLADLQQDNCKCQEQSLQWHWRHHIPSPVMGWSKKGQERVLWNWTLQDMVGPASESRRM